MNKENYVLKYEELDDDSSKKEEAYTEYHEEKWSIQNDLTIQEIQSLKTVSSDKEILEALLLSIYAAAKFGMKSIMQKEELIPDNVIKQIKLRGFDAFSEDGFVIVEWY